MHSVGDVESLVIFHSPPARPTGRVTGAGAGVDSAWEPYKLEVRKLLVNRADSHLSSARGVSLRFHGLGVLALAQYWL